MLRSVPRRSNRTQRRDTHVGTCPYKDTWHARTQRLFRSLQHTARHRRDKLSNTFLIESGAQRDIECSRDLGLALDKDKSGLDSFYIH